MKIHGVERVMDWDVFCIEEDSNCNMMFVHVENWESLIFHNKLSSVAVLQNLRVQIPNTVYPVSCTVPFISHFIGNTEEPCNLLQPFDRGEA